MPSSGSGIFFSGDVDQAKELIDSVPLGPLGEDVAAGR
jgi:hypothetical protein